MTTEEFQQLVWNKGRELFRDMPWRSEPTLYYVLVSELMLQQTQVSRVLVKFAEFVRLFPTVEDLARASLADVLRAWAGLGYNRRAKFLHEAAKLIVLNGNPRTLDELVKLPGIGRHTAGAIMNYVYRVPTPFVETNIRTVYFHHFFVGRIDVTDTELLQLVGETMDDEHPREWFWALMDYGSELKSRTGGLLDQSRHYKRQSPLKGSIREVRGQIITALTATDMTETTLKAHLQADERFAVALAGVIRDGLVAFNNGNLHLTNE